MIESRSPYTVQLTAQYQHFSNEKIEQCLADVVEYATRYRHSDWTYRQKRLLTVASNLRTRKYELAELITSEMGKLISESLAEIEKCAWVCEYYAEKGRDFLGAERTTTDASSSGVLYVPLGTVLAIMPWNFPFWQVFRFAAPAVMAGNTMLLKHSSIVPRCALEIESIFNESGFDGPVIKQVFATKEQISHLIADDRIAAVTLTGSEAAGKSIAKEAGYHLKKVVLELGGSDPYIVLDDADLDLAVEACVKGRMLNTGQSCIGAKRFIIQSGIYDEFLQKFRVKMSSFSFGDPMNNKTTLGPLASIKQREDLHEQVLTAVANGAHLMVGGYVPDEIEGAFYPATILTEVDQANPIYSEEVFGPVAMVFRVDDVDQAIALANDTSFGLGAAIFSKNTEMAQSIAETRLDAGSCFINAQVKSDPRLPFGGIKKSGFGRELSMHGIREFTNIKTIYRK